MEPDRGVADYARRDTLLGLLVEQEIPLGMTRQQLARLDRHIAGLRVLIDKQVELTEKLELNGRLTERSVSVLATLKDIMAIYQSHRAKGRRGGLAGVPSC
jgi:hypothetical protein